MGQAKVCGHDIVFLDSGMPTGRLVLPLFDKVLVRRDEAPDKAGVIWIPPSVRDSQPVLSGTVVATGPEAKYVVPGDYVVFSQYAGSMVKVDGITYVAMKEVDIHTIIRSV